MGLKSLMEQLKNRGAVTSVTPEKIMGLQPEPAWIGVCTLVTPVTPHFADTHANTQIGQLGEAVNDPTSSEPPVLENLRKPAMPMAANDPAQVVGLVANPPVSSSKISMPVCIQPAAMPDPDRWCWPHSSAMTGREIDTMAERTSLFNRRGLAALDAELLADKLVNRDREADERRLCLECAHLSRAGGLRCAQWQRAGLGAPGVPAGLELMLQRCDEFKDQNPQRTTS